ncbi:MAG TPA: hypothetical protein VHV78_18505 [Gemmatimonadaceae bacterium]|nr:hypothetical protein [Gemmatimonadaceae bacterium]
MQTNAVAHGDHDVDGIEHRGGGARICSATAAALRDSVTDRGQRERDGKNGWRGKAATARASGDMPVSEGASDAREE